MKIPYSPLPGITSRIVLAPMVPVTLSYDVYDFSSFALVDSGATNGIISTTIAEALAIKWRNIPAQQGFSTGGVFRFHPIGGLFAEIYGQKFQLSLSIVEGVSPYRFILGQADLFHQAKITFEEYKKQFEIDFRRLN